jgi:hypothetical protein
MVLRVVTAMLLALALAGCRISVTRGSGKMATETREVSGFNAVELSWLGDLAITQGPTESLTIEADDNILPLITSKVEGGTLVIGLEGGLGSNQVVPTRVVKYSLGVKDLSAVDLSGAGNISAPSIRADQLRVGLSGAGNVSLDQILATRLEVRSSGAGKITVGGQADTEAVVLSGLGAYEAGGLRASDVSVTISGAGGATVWAESTLDAIISGAGGVSYYGSPLVTKTISGLGSLRPLGAK